MKRFVATTALLLACTAGQALAQNATVKVIGPADITDPNSPQTPVQIKNGRLQADVVVTSGGGTGGGGSGAVPDVFTSATLALGTANAVQSVPVPITAGQNVSTETISGLTGTGAVVIAEGNSGGTANPMWGPMFFLSASTGNYTSTVTADSSFSLNVAGRTDVRLRVVTAAGTASNATVTFNRSVAVRDVGIDKPLPPGNNALGTVVVTSAPPVTGTVNISGTLPAFATTPTFNIGTAPNLTITNSAFTVFGSAGTFFQQGNTAAASANSLNVYIGGQFANLGVTGTVTSNIGTTGGLALANQFAASLGSKTGANSPSFVPASDATFPSTIVDGGSVTLGSKADAACTSTTASCSEQAILKGLLGAALDTTTPSPTNMTRIGGNAYTLGATTGANSAPVVLSTDGTYAKTADITNLAALFPTSLGQKTTAGSLAVTLSSDGTYAKTTDITALSAQLPASLGAKASAGSVSFVPASDSNPATSTLQTAGNTSAATTATNTGTIAGSLPPARGPQTMANSTAITAATDGVFSGVTAPAVTGLVSNVVLKASPGALTSLNVTSSTVSGAVMVLDATALPANGTVAPRYCTLLTGQTPTSLSLAWPVGTQLQFTTGIVVAFSSGSSCTTLTASATAYITGGAR